jgi:hypothetical protein
MKNAAHHISSLLIPASVAMVVIFVGCGSDSPGETPRADAGKDSAADIARDSLPVGPDLGTDLGKDLATDPIMVWDPDVYVDVARDVPVDRAVDAPVYDGPSIDGPRIDAPGVDQQIVDAGPCPTGQVLRYTSPGCGAEAKPVCGSPNQDACARSACGCSGKLIIGCDFFSEPWSSLATWTTVCAPDGGATIDTGVSEAGRLD